MSPRAPSVCLEPLEERKLLAANVPVNVSINSTQTLQTMEGMGASMITWHFNPEYQDPNFYNLIVGDLGATMARAPILPLAEQTNDDNDPNHFNWAGFDSNQLAAPFDFFQQLQLRGMQRFVGSVWTAPAWMKTNSAYTDGGALRPDDYSEFAEYLSAVTQIASRDYGVNLMAISPQNEPYFVEPYESTTYTANQYARMLAAVVTKFKADGVKTKLIGPEDLIYEDRNSWYLSKIAADPIASQYDGYIAGHGLQGHWAAFDQVIGSYGKEWWQTEMSGNSNTWGGAMGVASSIMSAVGDADASAFLYWQFSDAAASINDALMLNGQPTVKYYAAKQFYRYIRPGMVHVGSTTSVTDGSVRSASFKDPTTGRMTTVIINTGPQADVTLDLSGSNLPGSYKVFRSSNTENMVSLGNITGGSKFTLTIPNQSIVTITNMPELTMPTNTTAIPANTPFNGTAGFWVGKPAFFTAAFKGYDDVMRQVVDQDGQDINATINNGWTGVMLAAGSPHPTSIDTLKSLIGYGANINTTNSEGWTPLIAASANTFTKYGSSPTMQADKITALLADGADVNARDINGRTALMWASMMGAYNFFTQDPSLLQALLKGGANPSLKDNFGKTALDYANAGGYDHLADVLVAALGTDKTKPTGSFVPVSPNPRDTPVTDFDISFSERIQGFDLADVTLTRDGVNLPLPTDGGVLLTSADDDDGQKFHLAGLGGFTNGNGTYVLKVTAAGSGITDPSSNPLAADFSDTWVKSSTVPPPPPPTQQNPFKGTPFQVSSSATTQIEFEDFDTGGEGVAYHDVESKNLGGVYRTTEGVDIQPTTDAGGGFNVGYTKPGEWLEYTINVTDAGSYNLNFRIASTGSNGTFNASIDGVDVTGALTVPNTGGYQTFTTLNKSGVNLAAGQHILRITMDAASSNGSVGNFNWMQITQTTTPPPPPPNNQTPFKGSPFQVGSTAVTIQTEDFDNGGEGIAYHDTESANLGGAYRTSDGVDIQTSTDSGGGFNVGYTKAGEWLEYTINVATAGSYDFNFRLASTGNNGKFHAEIDGANVIGSLTVPNTGGYQTWQTLTKNGVSLAAGQHVLRIAMDSLSSNGSVGNFNWLSIAPSNTPPPPPTQTPFHGTPFQVGSTAVTIQTEDFDNGGEGVAYHDSDTVNSAGANYRTGGVDVELTGDTGGGYDVGFTNAGEWLEYTLNVAQAGTYNFDFRVSSKGAGGSFHSEIDGTNVTGALTVPNTNAWSTFTDVTRNGIALTTGQHVLRLAFDTVGGTTFTGDFNWLKITQASANPSTSTTINASSAAYVRGGTFAGTNFGSDPTLVVKKHTDPASSRESYLTFTLPASLNPIQSATLRLFGALNDTSSASVQSQVFAAGGGFDESMVNWNTRPGSTGNALSTITVAGPTQQWYTFDITSFLQAAQTAGQTTVTLALKNPTQQNALVVFNSDEAASNQPQIVVTT